MDDSGKEVALENLKVGDKIRFYVIASGPVEGAAVRVRIKRKGLIGLIETHNSLDPAEGVWVEDKTKWRYDYTLNVIGDYETYGFIKVNGQWQ